MTTPWLSLVFTLLGAAACHAPVGSELAVPEDAALTCRDQCSEVGMELSAMAIMANNVGCVCVPSGRVTSGNSAGITGGMATLALQDAEARRQQQQQSAAVSGP